MEREFNRDLLNYLICPMTREELEYDEDKQLLVNLSETYGYKVKNGTPVMYPDEAVKLSEAS